MHNIQEKGTIQFGLSIKLIRVCRGRWGRFEAIPSLILAWRLDVYKDFGYISTLALLGSKSNEVEWNIH